MDTRWIINKDVDNQVVKNLADVLGIDEVLATLLVQRGVCDFDGAKKFFRPSLDHLHDPYLIKDMDKAVDRIQKAIENHEKILVYGDYDVDGTTAVAVVYSYLKNLINKKRIEFYIPDRYEEGYGISYKGIDYAADNGFSLVIALDCGIKAVEKIEYANKRSVDFIICDHHRPGDEIPAAVAVLDSKRPDCQYPYKELSGCGVGFKLVTAVAMRFKRPIEEVYSLLDYVAISIAADIVPMTGENRVLAYFGLEQINRKTRPGVEAVLAAANIRRKAKGDEASDALEREVTVNDIVFAIGPRINAAGRLKKAEDSVRLLLADKKEHAEKLAENIDNLNAERREFDNSITEEALAIIDADEKMRNAKSTVVFNKDWHKGVIGIVASRLTDTYYRPTIVLTEANGLITGSARSVKDFDIYDAIDSCSDLLEHFGGHKFAAGLSLRPENLEEFSRRFEEYVASHITEDELVPEQNVDIIIDFEDITPKFFRILKQFAPFGPCNLAPVFMTNNVVDNGLSRAVGTHKHLKLVVKQQDNDDIVLSGIAFQKGHLIRRIHEKEPFTMCYSIEENYWQGKTSLQLNVKDIKFDEQITEQSVKKVVE